MPQYIRAGHLHLLALVLGIWGLSLKATASQNKPPQAPADAGTLEPHWRFGPGQPFFQKATIEENVTLTIRSVGKVEDKLSKTFWSQYTPIEKRGGKWEVAQSIVGAKILGGLGDISYDTTRRKLDPVSQCLAKLRRAKFLLAISREGKVEKIKGLKKLVQNAVMNKPPEVKMAVEQLVRPEMLGEMAERSFALGPIGNRRVKNGESWTRKTVVGFVPFGACDVSYNYTYRGKEGKYDVIHYNATVQNIKPVPTTGASGKLLYTIKKSNLKKGRGEGLILFDRTIGRVVSSTGELRVHANLVVDIEGNQFDVEVVGRQKTTIKITDTNPLK